MTTQNSQLLELIHQVNGHQISNLHTLLLSISMSLPVSTAQKLNIYHWLLSLPLPNLTPFQMTILYIVGPATLVVLFFVLILLLLWLVRTVVPFILSRLVKHTNDKKFLQLTFPADTEKSAFATEELYRLLHTLSRQMNFWDTVVQKKNEYSLEIVSTKKEGIRYLLAASPKFIDIISRNLLSYLPGIKVTEVDGYLDSYVGKNIKEDKSIGIIELKFSKSPLMDL